ncbi:hypothetical protein [Streptomyces sp. NPDC059538]|uniref:hypothetical protein n=1 Tax=Streptomyces sp. NPDC059538 TaxID=3346860 RepID=UPI0036991E85
MCEESREGVAGVLGGVGAAETDGQRFACANCMVVVLGELPDPGRGCRFLGRYLEGVNILAVLRVRDALQGDRDLQRCQDGLLVARGVQDFGVGEGAARVLGGGQDHGRQ